MEIIYSGRRQADPAIEAELGAKYVSFDELLETADVVSLHCPLNDETKHLINADRLKQMREDAYLVNTTRGPVVDEQALVDALRKGEIKGAGLDVFEEEPMLNANHPLLGMNNVLCTPHLGYVEERTYESYYGTAVEQILAFVAGAPINVANPDVLKK
jgi:phosphoglycerate dehydrogenase-like enzyme